MEITAVLPIMNKDKQHHKLIKAMTKAHECLDRKTAQELITKVDKIRAYLQ
jgi:hypothetical protein